MKQRIYKKNRDVLVQLERGERVDKVEEAVGEQAGDYERLLRGMGKWEGGAADGKDVVGGERRRERGKRKNVVLDDEDDEDDEDEDDEDENEETDEGVERATKRVRIDDET